jgi:hypothetical protein
MSSSEYYFVIQPEMHLLLQNKIIKKFDYSLNFDVAKFVRITQKLRCVSKSVQSSRTQTTTLIIIIMHAVAYLVEALCYQPEGRRFDSR